MSKRTISTAVTGLAVAATMLGCSATHAGPRSCTAPHAANGTTISVDAQGNASSPYTGGTGFRCSNGTWMRISR